MIKPIGPVCHFLPDSFGSIQKRYTGHSQSIYINTTWQFVVLQLFPSIPRFNSRVIRQGVKTHLYPQAIALTSDKGVTRYATEVQARAGIAFLAHGNRHSLDTPGKNKQIAVQRLRHDGVIYK